MSEQQQREGAAETRDDLGVMVKAEQVIKVRFSNIVMTRVCECGSKRIDLKGTLGRKGGQGSSEAGRVP